MKDWKKVIIHPNTTIRRTIEVIDSSALQIALVLDENAKLLGTITDGDIRRAILKGVSLDEVASSIMNTQPITASANESRDSILLRMQSKTIRHMPVIGADGTLISMEMLDELFRPIQRKNCVVIMAGGLGSRLSPLTNECPKPLLTVGTKPILEIILENFLELGFKTFYVSLNYKGEMIEHHFGDGSRWGVQIFYLRENQRMGTAGALSLLPPGITEPVIVMNADLLTKVNFGHLLNFHCEHNAKATLCVRDYEFQVPYGVVKVEKHRLTGIEEKPIHQFFVSAGIYVLEPEVLEMIPKNTFYDMPSLLEDLLAKKHEAAVFPVMEYWLDIGRMADFEQANNEYSTIYE